MSENGIFYWGKNNVWRGIVFCTPAMLRYLKYFGSSCQNWAAGGTTYSLATYLLPLAIKTALTQEYIWQWRILRNETWRCGKNQFLKFLYFFPTLHIKRKKKKCASVFCLQALESMKFEHKFGHLKKYLIAFFNCTHYMENNFCI